MKIVRGSEDVSKIMENSCIVIWGAGKLGTELARELTLEGITEYYIYDSDDRRIKNKDNFISLEGVSVLAGKNTVSIVIAVKNDEIVNEIANKIEAAYGEEGRVTIFRYIPKDYAFLTKRLEEVGFYNGEKWCKALGGFSARKLLQDKLNSEFPFLCSRWGSIEGDVVYANLSGIIDDAQIFSLKNNAGFYPVDKNSIHKFAECSADAAKEIDVLIAGCWFHRLEELYKLYSPNAILVKVDMMYPFWPDCSWTSVLKGKKVLVVHPFAKLIEKQYAYRDKLFETQDILPNMNLIVYQAVQSMNGNAKYKSWFEALDKMKNDISKIDFDIALIGCGAYGMPLGAYIKSKLHKKAIHMGGTLQILFGIKGKRWESEGYDYQHKLYNEYWVRPTDDLKPENYKAVENGCYW